MYSKLLLLVFSFPYIHPLEPEQSSSSCGCSANRRDTAAAVAFEKVIEDAGDILLEQQQCSSVNIHAKCGPESVSIPGIYTKLNMTDSFSYNHLGGEFWMGTNKAKFAMDGETPRRRVRVNSFHMFVIQFNLR